MITAVALGLVIVLGAYLLNASPSTSHTLTGSITLRDFDGYSVTGNNGDCTTIYKNGYKDIHEGTQVIVSDADGKTLAYGSLRPGKYVREQGCAFQFTVEGVTDSTIYSISAGNPQRGGLQKSRSELDAANWSVYLTLG